MLRSQCVRFGARLRRASAAHRAAMLLSVVSNTASTSMKPSVCVIYTGGTIGMLPAVDGYRPAHGLRERIVAEIPRLSGADMPLIEFVDFDQLIDSANAHPSHWNTIAEMIIERYDRFVGFVVLHGTDTMAYTASALSFMLQGLGKPVILTGSQIPLCEIRNDARDNLIASVLIAARGDIPEVCVCFGRHLLRGNRTVKANAFGLDAFDSPNCLPLADIGTGVRVHGERLLASPGKPMSLQVLGASVVTTLRLFPGISVDATRNALDDPVRGAVLECYGAGTGPGEDDALMAVFAQATERGVVIVAVTQCLTGSVTLATYAAGSALARAGVIGGRDMSTEAALTKLRYLLDSGLAPAAVREMIARDLRGELTEEG